MRKWSYADKGMVTILKSKLDQKKLMIFNFNGISTRSELFYI